ncbi:MAG: MCE family protein, partial [Halioglobus sp.]|nr:MCE family protein [Halioglobus sp.]
MADTESAATESGFKLSAVWIIPLLALLLGVFLVVQAWMTEGPEIEISFSTATGLEQGKTRIKYRNVDIGVVEKVRLNSDFQGVIATAKLDRQAVPLLRADTRFWVVTAQVGISSITGLDTLLSGAYIQLAPGEGELGIRSFEALEQPPLTPSGAPGLRLELTAEHAASASTGNDVLYKGFKVGRVENRTFDPRERLVRYTIFIDAPYHELVNSAVRFWDISGFELSAGADGFRVETGSVDTMLLGGVAFALPDGVSAGTPVEAGTSFKLYGTRDEIHENPFSYGTYFVVKFSQSIKGLLPGAPVEYRGIPVGQVERIM